MISRRDVEHIARLARVELSEAEIVKFEKDLAGILAFVDKLGELDTSNIEPLTGGTNLENILREDGNSDQRTVNSQQSEALVDSAPRKREGYIEVQSVFERP